MTYVTVESMTRNAYLQFLCRQGRTVETRQFYVNLVDVIKVGCQEVRCGLRQGGNKRIKILDKFFVNFIEVEENVTLAILPFILYQIKQEMEKILNGICMKSYRRSTIEQKVMRRKINK